MGIRSFVASAQIGWRKRQHIGIEHHFADAIQSATHVLICLPQGLRELTLVKPYLPELGDVFAPAEMYLLATPGSHVANIFPRKGFRILAPGMNQSSWAGLPKPAFLRTLHANKIDLIIDLNLRDNPFVAMALLSFRDCVKIGISEHLGDPFYNLQIRTNYLRDERNIYRSFVDAIAQLKDPAPRGHVSQTRLSGL